MGGEKKYLNGEKKKLGEIPLSYKGKIVRLRTSSWH